jgi:hypothetical protein
MIYDLLKSTIPMILIWIGLWGFLDTMISEYIKNHTMLLRTYIFIFIIGLALYIKYSIK